MNETQQQLRPFRSLLVRAAEDVFKASVDREDKLKSQLNHLIAVTNEAACHDEIALYLRYQSARERAPIDPGVAASIIGKIQSIFNDARPPIADEHLRVAAWRLYAVYLARAFTYNKARQSTNARGPR